jgi:hypothetical protein
MLATTISLAAGLVLLFAAVRVRRLMARLWSLVAPGYVSQEWLTDHTMRDHS